MKISSDMTKQIHKILGDAFKSSSAAQKAIEGAVADTIKKSGDIVSSGDFQKMMKSVGELFKHTEAQAKEASGIGKIVNEAMMRVSEQQKMVGKLQQEFQKVSADIAKSIQKAAPGGGGDLKAVLKRLDLIEKRLGVLEKRK